MAIETIGWIGTGIMGLPMAGHLLKAGYKIQAFNRTASRADPLITEGAVRCGTPAEAADGADVVISIVSDSPDVKAVFEGVRNDGADGILSQLKPGALCIDMSTIAPSVAREIAIKVEQAGCTFLDAPVSGGKTGAETGNLAIMVGGSAADVARAQPLFDIMGKSTVHGGPVGHGQLIKSCNQILCGLNLLAVSEAVVFAKRMGLDPDIMLKAVAGGAAGSWAVENLGPRMVQRDFAPMFMVDLQQKDLRIVLDAAAQSNVPLTGTALVSQLLAANQAKSEGDEGTQCLVKTVARLADVEA
ncbi:MAG: NAD(P)-dependent oxidoreductase [Phycisphaerae bacterium]